MKFKRVLLSAFACDPFFGSDEEVGWQWAKQLSNRGLDVTVITRRSHQVAIENQIANAGECGNIKFQYVDGEILHGLLKCINSRNHIYYYVWQWLAYRVAKNLHAERAFDLIHHVTWVSFRQPSFMGLIDAPLYFGPVAGGDEIPKGYTSAFSTRQKITEFMRSLVNAFVRFDPLMRMTYRQAEKVFFTSAGHLARVPDFVSGKSQIELAIGMAPPANDEPHEHVDKYRAGTRLVFVGRCIALKGMDIGLKIFARVHQSRPNVTLTIIGDGSDRRRWMAAAKDLGIAKAIEWRGWMPKEEVQAIYKDFDLLFYPSFRDSGGFVVLEALQNGLPVVCFKLGGPGVVVDDSCGAAVQTQPEIELTIEQYANSVLANLDRVRRDPTLGDACRARVKEFSWDALINRIYGPALDKGTL